MKITISGTPGSGKSTASKLLAKILGLKHYSAGALMRQIGKEKGKDILSINRSAEGKIDKFVDEKSKKLGEEEDNFIMDGRLSFFFIPHSFKIFLRVRPKTAAKRIWNDLNENRREGEGETFKEVFHKMKQREKCEKKRYKKQYHIDYTNQKNYDLVIDTEYLNLEEAVSAIIGVLAERNLLK